MFESEEVPEVCLNIEHAISRYQSTHHYFDVVSLRAVVPLTRLSHVSSLSDITSRGITFSLAEVTPPILRSKCNQGQPHRSRRHVISFQLPDSYIDAFLPRPLAEA